MKQRVDVWSPRGTNRRRVNSLMVAIVSKYFRRSQHVWCFHSAYVWLSEIILVVLRSGLTSQLWLALKKFWMGFFAAEPGSYSDDCVARAGRIRVEISFRRNTVRRSLWIRSRRCGRAGICGCMHPAWWTHILASHSGCQILLRFEHSTQNHLAGRFSLAASTHEIRLSEWHSCSW